ncbi:unnamed protein product [Peniophora sp. CBMAI 1063]|nr:unnamed protein product [Peniophora sp. CBMAI 1063]
MASSAPSEMSQKSVVRRPLGSHKHRLLRAHSRKRPASCTADVSRFSSYSTNDGILLECLLRELRLQPAPRSLDAIELMAAIAHIKALWECFEHGSECYVDSNGCHIAIGVAERVAWAWHLAVTPTALACDGPPPRLLKAWVARQTAVASRVCTAHGDSS